MGIAIEPYAEHHVPAVTAFNRRMREGGASGEFELPESPVPAWLPRRNGCRLFQEHFLASDEDAVRGGYTLKFQDFSLSGNVRPVTFYHQPLSEGLVNPKYRVLGSQLILDAMRRSPELYALGMGGFDRPLPRMLQALGWKLFAVPFHFRVVHPFRFLRNVRTLRNSLWKRALLDAAAFSGAGWAGIRAVQARVKHDQDCEVVPEFGPWADELWRECHGRYAMVGSRDRETLRVLYPAGDSRFVRILVREAGTPVGWAVVVDTQKEDDRHFGDMRLGSIVDCVAAPERAPAVLRAAVSVLERKGVDLVVTNQSHAAWCAAARKAGLRSGPSNFILALSKPLARMLEPLEQTATKVHVTRGDGDGPIHL